ncbi:MAG: heavy metal-associated domain-containing protein [Sulfurimonadaceae bacterium]|jgi:copper chaperone CopZ|nr:heavy metal-associated domain-containing protein [Sulfurimonadaceae bacterium]
MKQTFEVQNIRCGGCVNTIEKALLKEGFKDVSVDLSYEPRKVTVELSDDASVALFRASLRKLGYPLVGEEIGFFDNANLKAKSVVSCAIGKFSDNK